MANRLWAPGRTPWVLAGLVVLVAAGGYITWRSLSPRESTDDAQVAGHVSPVAARVNGPVIAIRVQDNQAVKAGDVLVDIDPRDYELAVQKAEADLAAAQAAARAAQTGVPITSTTSTSELKAAETGTANAAAMLKAAEREVDASRAKVEAAKARREEALANATRAAQDLSRLKTLVDKDEISKQMYDAAVATDASARAAVANADASIAEAEANYQGAEARRVQATGALTQAQDQATVAGTAPQQIALTKARAVNADAQVQQAEATLAQATLNLERTAVRAPANGVISRRAVEVGQVVQAGQPLLAVTSLSDVWVVANFKETQLHAMRAGQPAEVSVDAYGGRRYHGKVDSIAAATGATFSLLPPDNATGNFVKVVQRVPVKIVLDPGQDTADVLRPGMSVTATVFAR
ncbi:MAG: efflux RND transporter periplasmic adaptor subunit [Vicinamibacterales bacterium]